MGQMGGISGDREECSMGTMMGKVGGDKEGCGKEIEEF